MSENIYRQLQKRLDLYSMGFPATESGIELKILIYLFSEDDAGMFLSLSHSLATASSIASGMSQPVEKVAAHLENMAERGLLFRLKKANSVKPAWARSGNAFQLR
jgi:electron transport complex protein RnfB